MTVNPIVKPSQPGWRERSAGHAEPDAPQKASSSLRSEDDADSASAARAWHPWPRVFPGL